MKLWTAHLRAGRAPVLLPERFSAAAFLLGPLWFLAHQAWIVATINLAAWALAALLPDGMRTILLLALMLAQGLFGYDLLRWSLEQRGYVLAHVVAAREPDGALSRLLHVRPDLAQSLAREV